MHLLFTKMNDFFSTMTCNYSFVSLEFILKVFIK